MSGDLAMIAQDELQLENVFADKAVPNWLKPNFDSILPELKAVPNWVLAKGVVRDGKTTKPPYQSNGQPASHSNPATWSTFADVKEAYKRGGYIGVGFVLDGKPHFGGRYLHGFDWDDCIENGQVDAIVQAELDKLSIPRKEVSVSGTGVRGFFLHHEPLASRRTKIAGRSVELYSALRYMTTTGWGKGVLA
jgi:putative DNA primase/helicase